MITSDYYLALDQSAIISARYIATSDANTIKLIIRTKESMKDVSLVIYDIEYEAFTNFDEPYDFTVHGFFVPLDLITSAPKFRMYMTGRSKKTNILEYPGQKCKVVLDFDKSWEAFADEVFDENNSRYKEVTSKDIQVTDGLTYRHITCENKFGAPVEMFLLSAEADKIGFELAIKGDGKPFEEKKTDENGNVVSTSLKYPIATIEDMAKEAMDTLDVKAAVNADFFDMFADNHPSGFCVRNGEWIVSNDESRPFFAVLDDGKAVISDFASNPELRERIKFAVTGSHIMSKDGQPGDFGFIQPFGDVRHPRTAVGIKENGDVLILVVDGRIPEYSNGATLVDLALTLKAFGAVDSINLDGGGSSIMLIRPDGEWNFEVQNRPADLQRPTEKLIRPCYNGILIYKKM